MRLHADAPDLGQDQHAIVQPRPVAILLVGEGVGAIRALEAGEACPLAPLDATEERLRGLVQPRQHILQPRAVDRLILRERGAEIFQLGFLLKP
jgi:hypothetical protein